MNAIVKASPPAAQSQGLIPRNMQDAMQLAAMMARGKMMPEHLRNDGDALMVIEQAMRWNMSPFAVAQNTFSIKGKLLFAGTIVAAAIENSGAIQGLMDYQFSGEGQNRKVTVSATRRGESAPRSVDVVLKDAVTSNEIWKKQPDQQLVYHGSRVWARRWTPGVMLGVYTPEEWRDAPPDTYQGTTLDHRPEPAAALNDAIPERVMAAPAPAQSVRDMVRERLAECESAADVLAVGELPQVKRAEAKAPPAVWQEIKDMMADRYGVFVNAPHDPDAGEVTEPEFPGDRP